MSRETGTILLLNDLSDDWEPGEITNLVRVLEQRLNQAIAVASVTSAGAPMPAAIEKLIKSGVQNIVLLPLGILPVPVHGRFQQALTWALQQRSDVQFYAAASLTWLEWSRWLRLTAIDELPRLNLRKENTTVLILGAGNGTPVVNANIARMSQMILEESSFSSVRYAFWGSIRPGIQETLQSIAASQGANVIAVPWQANDESIRRQLDRQLQEAARTTGCQVHLAIPAATHAGLVNLLVSNYMSALAEPPRSMTDAATASPSSGAVQSVQQVDEKSKLTTAEEYELQELNQRIDALLPLEYQGKFETVSPNSMGTASLKFDEEGRVAWDQIWTSFCDLALAGGPPHRGKLLEAVTSEEARSSPDEYQSVVDEISRGIRLVTALPIVESSVPGWVGVRCESEEMAIWLMRAIIVENIMVRREGDVIYLPAGPKFTVRREIKNVITAIAKTTHYWKAHLLTRRQRTE